MGAGTSQKKRPPAPHHIVNRHKIGHLHLDHYEADAETFQSLPCKVAIIGPARSGKTSLFTRFLTNSFATKTTHDTSANFGLRLVEYEHSPPIWFEVWDLPTHVPTHGGPPSTDEHYYGDREEEANGRDSRNEAKEYLRMNAWEAHDVPAYSEELRRSHTDPNTGLVSILKKDHDAVFCVIPASTFSSSSSNLDSTMDALLDDVGFLNDNTKNEILRVLVVSKIDELSPDEMDGILLQVSSYAEVRLF